MLADRGGRQREKIRSFSGGNPSAGALLRPEMCIRDRLTSSQLDDLAALRRNSDIVLYGIFPVTVSLILLIWGAVWFYRTFIESGL